MDYSSYGMSNFGSSSRRGRGKNTVIVIVAVIALIVGGGYALMDSMYTQTYVGTVTEKTIKRRSEDSDQYLVFVDLDNGGNTTLRIVDSFIDGRFDSSDWYGRVKVGQKYKFNTRGKRRGCASSYPNITEMLKIEEPVKPVKSEKEPG